ncbi:hypothetical protein HNP00_000174 [Arthrobacter sp. AZCC_0090]|nr:hypothetical protein [Arthrobacter sp. AZCC_0090]
MENWIRFRVTLPIQACGTFRFRCSNKWKPGLIPGAGGGDPGDPERRYFRGGAERRGTQSTTDDGGAPRETLHFGAMDRAGSAARIGGDFSRVHRC